MPNMIELMALAKNGERDSFCGVPVRASATDAGDVQAVEVNGRRIPIGAFRLGHDIVEATARGEGYRQENDRRRTFVNQLISAGVNVRAGGCGASWHLDAMPSPSKYLVKTDPSTAALKHPGAGVVGNRPWGKFGA